MTKLSNISTEPSIHQLTPTQVVVADANRIEYVTDARGHRLGVKRVNASLRRKVLKALSAESGEKGQLFGNVRYRRRRGFAEEQAVESRDRRALQFVIERVRVTLRVGEQRDKLLRRHRVLGRLLVVGHDAAF